MLTTVDLIFVVVCIKDVYLAPRLFSAVMEMALSSWRAETEAQGLSLEDGLKPVLDLRVPDDTLVFCTTLDKACLLLDELVASLAEVSWTLNVRKTRIFYNPNPTTVTNSWWGDGGFSRPCFSTQMARVLAPSCKVP